jgi:hypothetical protein
MPVIDLPLTPAQARKLSQGKRIRLTKGQVSREGDAVSVNMSSRLASKITRRLKAGKGFQLAHEWDSHATSGDGIGNPFKKLARATAGVVKTIRKKAPGVLKQVGHETGRIAQQAKKYVPRGIVKGAIADLSLAATSAIGQPELAPLRSEASLQAAYKQAVSLAIRSGAIELPVPRARTAQTRPALDDPWLTARL